MVCHFLPTTQDEEEDEEDEDSLGQETLLTARAGHASEFSAGQLPQYTEDTLIIHGDEVGIKWNKLGRDSSVCVCVCRLREELKIHNWQL